MMVGGEYKGRFISAEQGCQEEALAQGGRQWFMKVDFIHCVVEHGETPPPPDRRLS